MPVAIVSPAYGIQTRYELLMMQNKFTLEKEQCLLKYEMLFVCSKAYTIVTCKIACFNILSNTVQLWKGM